MRKIYLTLLLALTWMTLSSQLTINTIVKPPYSPYFEDYLQYDNKVVLIIQNNSNTDYEFYFKSSIIGDNGIEIVTKPDFRPIDPFVIAAHQVLQLSGGDLEPYLSLDNADLTGIEASSIIGAEGLPEGNYQICVQAFNWNDDTPVSAEIPSGCANIFIQNIEPSVIVSPSCGSDVIASNPQNIVFSWSISPGALPGTEYILQIVEVLDGQSPESAMGNFPKRYKSYKIQNQTRENPFPTSWSPTWGSSRRLHSGRR